MWHVSFAASRRLTQSVCSFSEPSLRNMAKVQLTCVQQLKGQSLQSTLKHSSLFQSHQAPAAMSASSCPPHVNDSLCLVRKLHLRSCSMTNTIRRQGQSAPESHLEPLQHPTPVHDTEENQEHISNCQVDRGHEHKFGAACSLSTFAPFLHLQRESHGQSPSFSFFGRVGEKRLAECFTGNQPACLDNGKLLDNERFYAFLYGAFEENILAGQISL